MSRALPQLAFLLLLSVVRASRRVPHDDVSQTVVLPSVAGVPELSVLYTADDDAVLEFLHDWWGEWHLGLMVARHDNRTSLVAMCANARVLIFDLRRRPAEQLPFPPALEAFMCHERRTFYGAGLLRAVSRFIYERGCDLRVVDFAMRKWPGMELGGGLRAMAQRHLGVGETGHVAPGAWQRPLSVGQVTVAAENVYLRWALAMHFRQYEGEADEDWLLNGSEMDRHRPDPIQDSAPHGAVLAHRRRREGLERRRPKLSWVEVAASEPIHFRPS
mmetsp:Transcript_115580/g.323176  ORF Transcript_115580/g.323176 Transcript_115580/m.323176 type:complete len:274 (-) Transcript_115580:90-911(-)